MTWTLSNLLVGFAVLGPALRVSYGFSLPGARPTSSSRRSLVRRWVGDAQGDYYGESAGSFMVKEFGTYEDLEELVKLASLPLPERPDGIVLVAKYSSAADPDSRATEAEYERLARENSATIFLRCFKEFENVDMLLSKAQITVWPTFDVFYQGNRVSRVEGSSHVEVQEVLDLYQFQNSNLDLFSEDSVKPWGDGEAAKEAAKKTPRTTNRFVPGYDWNSERGFFDAAADKAESSLDYGNWLPNVDDDR